MTTKPVAYKTKLAGSVGRLEVAEDADIGDEVAYVVVGKVKARNEEGTDAGPVLTIGVKAPDFFQLPNALADELILSVKRHGRARTLELNGGNVPLDQDSPDDELGLGDTPDAVVDRWLAGHTDGDDDDAPETPVAPPAKAKRKTKAEKAAEELATALAAEASRGSASDASTGGDDDLELDLGDDLDDLAGALAADEDLGDPMPRRPVDTGDDAIYVKALEAAWDHVDRATPGYGDQSEPERQRRTFEHVGTISPWALRQYLLIETDELAGSELFIRKLEARHAEELKRISAEEPWPGFAKSTVDAVLGRLTSRKASDDAAGNRESILEHVEVYELGHKGRKTVLAAIAEERLGHNETGVEPTSGDDFEPTIDHDAEPE